MPRIIAVGNINGDYTTLKSLMEEVNPRSGDLTFFLGSHVGTDGQSNEVIDYLNDMHAYRRTFHVAGGLDVQLRDWLAMQSNTPQPYFDWGGVPTAHERFLLMMDNEHHHDEPMTSIQYHFTHARTPNQNATNVHAGLHTSQNKDGTITVGQKAALILPNGSYDLQEVYVQH